MRKVLVAVDGSTSSSKALQEAADIAKNADVPLVIAHVVAPSPYMPSVYSDTLAKIAAEAQRYSEEILKGAAEFAESRGAKVERVSLKGAPAETLSEFAQSPDIWLVVAGSHGKKAIERMLLGSVANRLIHICPKPILIVRQ